MDEDTDKSIILIPQELPILVLDSSILFPNIIMPYSVKDKREIHMINETIVDSKLLGVFSKKPAGDNGKSRDEIFEYGSGAVVLKLFKIPDGSTRIIIQGLRRIKIKKILQDKPYLRAEIQEIEDVFKPTISADALQRTILNAFRKIVRLSQNVPEEIITAALNIDDPSVFADFIASNIDIPLEDRQVILMEKDVEKRLKALTGFMGREIKMIELGSKIQSEISSEFDKTQRKFFLREQLRAIKKELGEDEDVSIEVVEFTKKIKKANMPVEAKKVAEKELERLKRINPAAAEYSVAVTYLDWLTTMPWTVSSKDRVDIKRAQKILDEDHHGLIDIKERILEYLAIRKLNKNIRGPILCFVGPPGVGKTSLGQSIARALGRKFVRISLGGIRDEAEIRGHRRTYIGALPGRIIQSMKKCGVKNPVFMLDEIDKLSVDFRGDPSSALLEVLDPEQNKAFSDHYLEVDFDLHEVFFITTANSEYDILEALLDRMEIVRLPGYTTFEKERIAELFLVPKQIKESGLSERYIQFTSKGLQTIIFRYTREAGVRELERQIANVCRKVARQVVDSKKGKAACVSVTEKRVMSMLGPPPHSDIDVEAKPDTGVCVGLAWTQDGGDTLVVETSITRGKGELKLTGQMGEVMQESAQAAYTYLREHANDLQVPTDFWKNRDVHVHVPEGAIPKDGPSAGSAIAVSMLSAMRKRPPMAKMAMTGEITLRGRILAVGGMKEKVLAAHRARIETVFLPKLNEKELVEIPKEVRRDVRFIFVDTLDEIIQRAFPARRRKRS